MLWGLGFVLVIIWSMPSFSIIITTASIIIIIIIIIIITIFSYHCPPSACPAACYSWAEERLYSLASPPALPLTSFQAFETDEELQTGTLSTAVLIPCSSSIVQL